MILTLRTDKPESEIGLFAEDGSEIIYDKWQAHRKLAETINSQIAKNLQFASGKLSDITAIVVYKGPGSYTGLRIGISVANALAYSNDCPIVATNGVDWQTKGINNISKHHEAQHRALPFYEAPARTTQPKK